MKKICLIFTAVLMAFSSYCLPQSDIERTSALLDMMYMCPFNYNSCGLTFKLNKVNSVNLDYAGINISMSVDREGRRDVTDIDSIAVFNYNYYDDGRMSDLELVMKGYDNVRSRMLFTYGSPTADFDAVFLFPSNVGTEQKAVYFCDGSGRVLRMSMSVQKLETVKCEFVYKDDRIVRINYAETGPEYFAKLNMTAVYTYRQDGLIDTETVTMPDGKEIVVPYKYSFYE